MVIADILNAAAEPLTQPLGWQAFAYGLLGLRTMRRVIEWARDIFDPTKDESTVEVVTKGEEDVEASERNDGST